MFLSSAGLLKLFDTVLHCQEIKEGEKKEEGENLPRHPTSFILSVEALIRVF